MIPKALQNRLGIRPGETLDFREKRRQPIARRTRSRDPVDALYGILELPARPDVLLDEVRGPGPTALITARDSKD